MATNRNDMELGSTSISTPILNPSDNSFNMIYNMNNNISNDGLKIKSFLQGANLVGQNSGKIGIKSQNLYRSGKQILLTLVTPSISSIVKSLTISVVLFNINTPSVLYADGSIDQNFVVSTTNVTIPRHGIN
jgi:hypothetical protein